MQCTRRVRGFTLIELLIVVAIIAILALIAVPNFLEAQTRAKIARVKADLRSLATAQEAYFTDWNSYTCKDMGDNARGVYDQGFAWLTSPVAYITSIPWDEFGEYDDVGVHRKPMLEMGTGDASTYEPSGTPPNDLNPKGMPSNTWLMRSTGPDRIDDTHVNSYPWPPSRVPHNDSGIQMVLSYIYDPTNGTVSFGDVYRVGGMKPAGAPWDIFFANSMK